MNNFYRPDVPYLPFGLETVVPKSCIGVFLQGTGNVTKQEQYDFLYVFTASQPTDDEAKVHDSVANIGIKIVFMNKEQVVERKILVDTTKLSPFSITSNQSAREDIFFAPRACGYLLTDGQQHKAREGNGPDTPFYKAILVDEARMLVGYHMNYSNLHKPSSCDKDSQLSIGDIPHLNHPFDFFIQWDQATDIYVCQMQMFHGIDAVTAFLKRAVNYAFAIGTGAEKPYMNEISICVRRLGSDETVSRLKKVIKQIAKRRADISATH